MEKNQDLPAGGIFSVVAPSFLPRGRGFLQLLCTKNTSGIQWSKNEREWKGDLGSTKEFWISGAATRLSFALCY